MIYCVNSYGNKGEYYEKFIEYFNGQLKIKEDRFDAFRFAQKRFANEYGFQLFKQIDLFLNEVIEVEEGYDFHP